MSYRSIHQPPRHRHYAQPQDSWASEAPDAHHRPLYQHAPVPPQHARLQQRPPVQAQSPRRKHAGGDYTLAHGRRQVRLGPFAFWVVVGGLIVMAGWSVLTGTYFAFHDDVLKRLIARQAEMQFAYEDRIAELRAQVDRIASRQLLDQEQFEQKLDQAIRKQAVLEQRTETLSALPDMMTTGSIPKPAKGGHQRRSSLRPSPIDNTDFTATAPDREARSFVPWRNSNKPRGGLEAALARVQDSLERLEAKQASALNALEESFEAKAKRIRSALADIGINTGKAAAAPSSGVGGPYVPANLTSDNKSFERQLSRIQVSRLQVDRLTRTLNDIPIRKPVSGEIDMSSGFGMRMDPFLRSPAMHTGLDMRGDTGEPVRVTANGTVTIAGVNGGYGKLVEVEHSNGLATRYAHLSSIDVRLGQTVKIGQIIGKIGSTGRSTGPHLHYETRVDGDPVDPQKYLRAGVRLGLNELR
ncbi:M23 family metallopeptidase [Pseudorhodoplanes sinuspersici]|nr:peptidase M23-like protein [Pseudorhodoplanes sinuspersici]